jgi:hypothetical protein
MKLRPLSICILAIASFGQGTQPCRSQSLDSNEILLHRMKADYRRWISNSPSRDLLVEFDPDPIAIRMSDPRFSWGVPLAGRGRMQTAYRLRVASRPELLQADAADMWD